MSQTVQSVAERKADVPAAGGMAEPSGSDDRAGASIPVVGLQGIAFWGNFGTHNFGNECTLHAMRINVRHRLPQARLLAICSQPGETNAGHGIDAIPIVLDAEAGLIRRGAIAPLLSRIWRELSDWPRVFGAMRGVDLLVMTGTGLLTDTHHGFLDTPYQILKWCLAARLCGTRVAFVSVGAEGLENAVKTAFIAGALRLAGYRSYRDDVSRRRASRLLAAARHDPIYPDLAFSLPRERVPTVPPAAVAPTVAVGIYTVHGSPQDIAKYGELIGGFVLWLLGRGCRVRIVIGDAEYDPAALAALRAWLAQHDALERVIDEAATSFQDLMHQIAEADLVVATRFHNLVLALLLGKPAMSISHMDKNDELMNAMGLEHYRVSLDGAEPDRLRTLFLELEREAPRLREQIRRRADESAARLEEQYDRLFGRLAT